MIETHNLPTGTSAWDFANAEAAATRDAILASETCTMCEADEPDGLVPWGKRERLCWHCTDVQLDLLALACQTESGLPVQVKLP